MSAAPIQLSYIGYLGTMGADYYDYLIADPMMIPKENQKYYSEKIVYLPNFQVNDSKDSPPEVILLAKMPNFLIRALYFAVLIIPTKLHLLLLIVGRESLKVVEGSVLIIYAIMRHQKQT